MENPFYQFMCTSQIFLISLKVFLIQNILLPEVSIFPPTPSLNLGENADITCTCLKLFTGN